MKSWVVGLIVVNEIMFIHIREAEEINKAKRLLGAKTLLITNPHVKIITSNDSDKKVNQYEYDYYIDNDGTIEDLSNKALEFIQNL